MKNIVNNCMNLRNALKIAGVITAGSIGSTGLVGTVLADSPFQKSIAKEETVSAKMPYCPEMMTVKHMSPEGAYVTSFCEVRGAFPTSPYDENGDKVEGYVSGNEKLTKIRFKSTFVPN